jgi:hypothetical protein
MSELMTNEELGELLNQLLEAERAGSKLLAAWLDDLAPESPLFVPLRDVQRDEASNCAVLIEGLRGADVEPTARMGGCYTKGVAIRDWRERLEFSTAGRLGSGDASPRRCCAFRRRRRERCCRRCTIRTSPTSNDARSS